MKLIQLLLYIGKPKCLVMFWKENVSLVKWGCLYLALVFFKVFDAYAQFEESMISAKMETTAEMGATEEGTFQQLWYSFYIAIILQLPETILRLERIKFKLYSL